MSDCLSRPEMTAFVNENAPVDRLAAWRRHLRTCDQCAATVVRVRAGIESTRSAAGDGDTRTNTKADDRLVSGLEPNVRLGDFLLEQRLGAGGMGVVYQARQVSLNRLVALKILPVGFAVDASAVERFRREARAAAKLRHRNIVTIYAEGAESTVCYYAMEMIEGHNLDYVIKNLQAAKSSEVQPEEQLVAERSDVEHDFPADDAPERSEETCCLLDGHASKREYSDVVARLISEVADALEYAHSKGIIHRDIKPSNLMLTRDGRLVLLDFGVARIAEEQAMTITGSFVGTPMYMSPEQIESDSKETDHRSDIYSLGVTLYELLTLTPLFNGNSREKITRQIINEEPKRPRQIDRHIPIDLETICCKAIEKEPNRRYQNAGEFAGDLRRYLERRPIRARRVGPAGRAAKFVLRHKIRTALVAGIILVSGIAGSIAWKHYTTRWAQQDAMAQIDQHIAMNDYFSAFMLARKAERYIPNDPLLVDRWKRITREHSITTTPAGAKIFIGEYSSDSKAWEYIGRSPIEHARIPFGTHVWKVEKTGFISQEVIRSNDLPPPSVDPATLSAMTMEFVLHENGSFASDMAFIPAAELKQDYLWHGTRTIPSTPAFLMDKYEVTNRQFKAFVDSGGYGKSEYCCYTSKSDGLHSYCRLSIVDC